MLHPPHFLFYIFLCSDGPDLSLTFVLDNDADENSFIFLLLYAGEKKMCSMGIKNSPSWQGNGGTYAKGGGKEECVTQLLLFSFPPPPTRKKEKRERRISLVRIRTQKKQTVRPSRHDEAFILSSSKIAKNEDEDFGFF